MKRWIERDSSLVMAGKGSGLPLVISGLWKQMERSGENVYNCSRKEEECNGN